jgi:hypothetical protein
MARTPATAPAAAAAPHHQPASGFLILVLAVLLSTTWRALEGADPGLMPEAVAAYAWAPAARAYAGWPLAQPWPHKLAYFLRHLPLLITHIHGSHW